MYVSNLKKALLWSVTPFDTLLLTSTLHISLFTFSSFIFHLSPFQLSPFHLSSFTFRLALSTKDNRKSIVAALSPNLLIVVIRVVLVMLEVVMVVVVVVIVVVADVLVAILAQ